jgi:S1-C subfamily serine protease
LFSSGTGLLIDRKNRLILTTYHVVQEAKQVAVLFPVYEQGKLVQNEKKYMDLVSNKADSVLKGPVVARDRKCDLALVQLASLSSSVDPLALAVQDVTPGDSVYLVGNPSAGGLLWVVSTGKVRDLFLKHTWKVRAGEPPTDTILESDVIVTDVSITPGEGGAPLVNDRAELVGVTHGIDPSSRLGGLFINRTEVIRFVENYCSSKGLTWERSDRKPE